MLVRFSPLLSVDGPPVGDSFAPTVLATGALSGRTYTITTQDVTGSPAPSVALTALTLDGVDVLADATGTGPWTYSVPSSASAQTVAWTVTASNGTLPNGTSSGSVVVAADLVVPVVTVALAQASYVNGESIDAADIVPTISEAGIPALEVGDLTKTLRVDGLAASLPHTAATGEIIVGRVTATHPTGNIEVDSSSLTVAPVAPAPTIDSVALTNNGDGTGSMTVSFAEGETAGASVEIRLYIDTPADADPDAATAWAGTGAVGTGSVSTTVGATGVSIAITGTLSGEYEVFAVASYDGGTNISPVAKVAGNVEFDNVASTLSSLTGTQTGTTTATWAATSNEAGGTIYAAVRLASDPALSRFDIRFGAGNAVATSSDASPTADANNGGSFTGLTANTEYDVDAYHVDASGNESAVVSSAASFTAASAASSAIPQVTGYTEAWSGNASTLDITAPTTTATDTILLLVTHRTGTVTITMPSNFTEIYNSGNGIAVGEWDGTGTRPNANTQTITFSASESCGAQMLALDSGAATHLDTLADATGSTATMPAASTTNANALVLSFWRYRTSSQATSYSGVTPDETAFSNPDTEFQEWIQPQSDHRQLIQTVEQEPTGAINRMTMSNLVYYSGVVVEIA